MHKNKFNLLKIEKYFTMQFGEVNSIK